VSRLDYTKLAFQGLGISAAIALAYAALVWVLVSFLGW
jgi:hypothetical protein